MSYRKNILLLFLLAMLLGAVGCMDGPPVPTWIHYAVIDTIPSNLFWHTNANEYYGHLLPGLNTGLPYKILQDYTRLDSLGRIEQPSPFAHRDSSEYRFYDSLPYGDRSRLTMKYFYSIRDYDPIQAMVYPVSTGYFLDHVLQKYPDSVQSWALASSSYVLHIRVIDTASTYSSKQQFTAVVADVLDTLKGRILPPAGWQSSRPVPANPDPRIGRIAFQYSQHSPRYQPIWKPDWRSALYTRQRNDTSRHLPIAGSMKNWLKPGHEYIAFLQLVKYSPGHDTFCVYTVRPIQSRYSRENFIYPIENGFVQDSSNEWGLGASPKADDFLRMLRTKIDGLAHPVGIEDEAGPIQAPHYGIFDTIPVRPLRLPNSGLSSTAFRAYIQLDSLCSLFEGKWDQTYQFLTYSDTSRSMAKNYFLARDGDPMQWIYFYECLSNFNQVYFPTHVLEKYPDSTQSYALLASDYILHIKAADTAESEIPYRSQRFEGKLVHTEVLANVFDTIKGKVFQASLGFAASDSQSGKSSHRASNQIAFRYNPREQRLGRILNDDWRKTLRAIAIDDCCGPERADAAGDMIGWVKRGKEYIVFLQYQRAYEFGDNKPIYVLEPTPGYSLVNYIYTIEDGHVQDPGNEWGLGTSPTTQDFLNGLHKKIEALTHPY